MRRSLSTSVAVSLLTTLAIAQQRSPFFATVVGPDGKPLAEAEVTCVFTPSQVLPGTPDVVKARTDARGRARCDLRVGLLYVAWATGPVGAAGTCFVSEPIQLVAAGRVAELSAWAERKPPRWQLGGVDAWRTAGAVAVRWFPVAGEEVAVDVPIPADNVLALPAAPRATGCLALVDAQGELLVTTMALADAEAVPPFVAPAEFVVTVADAAGAPIAGAAIEHQVPIRMNAMGPFGWHASFLPRLRRAAITDAEGKARFVAPGGRNPITARATKPGFGWDYASLTATGLPKTLKLTPATSTRVAVTGVGKAELTLGVQSAYQMLIGKGTAIGQHPVAIDRVDAAQWRVHPSALGFTPRLCIEKGSVPIAVVLDYVAKPPESMTIDLSRHHRVDVRVTGPDGGPPGCALAIARVDEGHPVYWEQILAADSAGRATLLLPKGAFFVFATAGTAHALALVDPESTGPLMMQLEPLPTTRMRIVDAAGKPVVGARALGSGSSGGDGGSDTQDGQLARVAFDLWSSYAALPSSGPDGVLVMPVFLPPGMRARVYVSAGSRKSEAVGFAADAEQTVVLK